MGLIPILRGKIVSGLAERTAIIDCKSGAKLTFYPPTGAGAVLMTGSAGHEAGTPKRALKVYLGVCSYPRTR